jgi:membrane-associated phospholipid phosphatase
MSIFITTAVVAGTGLVALAMATRTRRVQRLDDLLEEKAGPRRQYLRRVAGAATLTGEKFVHPVIAAVTAGALFLTRPDPPLHFVLPLASASLGGIIAHHLVKFVYHRPRPQVALDRDKTEAAFPSGHTTNATAVVATSAYLLVREGLVPAPVALVGVIVLCLATGLSRVALGWHWGTDVIGGWLAGSGIAALCCGLFEALRIGV